MSKKISGLLLLFILLINVIAIISVEVRRHNDDDDNKNEDTAIETEENSEEQDKEDNNGETEENADDGEISEGGLFIKDAEASEVENADAIEKSKQNNILMNQTGRWIATDYSYGDITSDRWTVLKGDTLWEISEAKYGNGL